MPQHLGKIAEISGKWRDQVKAKLTSVTERRRFWEKMFSGRFANLIKNQQQAQAEQELAEQLESNYQRWLCLFSGCRSWRCWLTNS